MLKELRRNYKRIVAFMLTVVMTFTNIGSNLSVAFAAGETEEALFMLNGNDLQSAIQDAVEGGEVFDFNSLELTAKSTSLKNSYQKLLGTKSGDVYALDVEIDDSYAPDSTSMEAFYNAGTEDVVFLFINESDMVVTFRANVDGYETNRVTINPNAANVEDDADAGYVEDYSNTTMVDDTPETLGATVVPAQSEEGNAVEIETVESVEAEEADVVETEAAAETEESEEVASEAEKETVVETEAEEVVIETEAETEAETESEVEAEIEAEQSEESAVEVEEEAADEVQVGLSMHAVSRVATTVEILDDEVPMAEEAQVEDEDAEEITDEETTAAEIAEGSEVEVVEETTAAEETVVESAEAETAEEETEAVDAETEAEDETEGIVIETEAAEESSEAADVPADVVVENETPSDAERDEAIADEDGQMLIDDSVEVLGDLDGTSYDTVTLWGSANARAFKISLETLDETVGINITEHQVTYTASENTAVVFAGEEAVEDGEDLTFAVKVADGYELESVTANGVELEALSVEDFAEYADYDAAYLVEAVAEDLEIIANVEAVTDLQYEIEITHKLNTDLGDFIETTTVELTEDDFDENGKYDFSVHAIEKEGTVVVEGNYVALKSSFRDYYGTGVLTSIKKISYEVADGWVAYSDFYTSASSSAMRSVYVGTFDDVTIVPVDKLAVTYVFSNEDGTIFAQSTTNEVTKEADGTASDSIDLDDVATLPDGYYLEVSTTTDGATVELTDGNVINSTFDETVEQATIIVTVVADTVEYIIETKLQNVPAAGETTKTYTTTTSKGEGKVGQLTEAVAEDKEGYVAEPIEQVEITADGQAKVQIVYNLKQYSVTYDTDGGSYVKAKTGLYHGQTVEVYAYTEGTEGSKTLICTKEEHTHSRSCLYGYYCDKEEHTHSDSCYEIVEAIPASYDPTPTKEGYTFAGWYSDEACTTVASQSVTGITGDITVYAKWVPKTVKYTIVYMKQNLNGGYDFVDATTAESTTGSKVSGSANSSLSFDGSSYYHYAKADTDVEVRADGKTVVKVYYDLNTYKIVFDLSTGESSISMTIGGTTYTKDSSPQYTITVKYGEDISEKWPTSSNFTLGSSDASFYGWKMNGSRTTYVSKRFEVTSDMLSSNTNNSTTTYNAQYQNGSKVVLHYMLQNADNDEYTDSEKYGQEVYSSSGSFSAKEIYGFTHVSSKDTTKKVGEVTNYYFYYTRDTYDIKYYYGTDNITNKTGVKFGANINNSTYNYIPDRPEGVEADYTFAGWFDNVDGYGEPYTFTTMPANNLPLYARWDAPEKTLTLVNNNGDQNSVITVNKNDVPSIETPVKEGYIFGGWYTDADCTDGNEYDVNAPLTEDITIYAMWIEITAVSYTVRHVVVNSETGDYEDIVAVRTVAAKKGQTVIERAKAFTSGDYEGWVADANSKSLTLTDISATYEIVFVYSSPAELKYSVIYTYNGETKASQENIPSNGVVNVIVYPDETIVNSLRRDGYTVNETFGKKTLVSDYTQNTIEFTLSLLDFTITYEGLSGITGWEGLTNTTNPNPTSYNMETPDITLINPVKEGYTFTGWEMGEGTTNPDEDHTGTNVVITIQGEDGTRGNLVFVATWEEKVYMVHYDVNGATSGSIESKTDVKWNDANLLPATEPTRDGYTFEGWKYGSVAVTNSKKYSTLAADDTVMEITLVAQWSANPDKLTYDANGGSGTTVATEGKVDETVTVAENNFSYASHYFVGWNTASDGSGTSYVAGDDYVLTPGEDILYAQWEQNYAITVTAKSDSVLYTGKDQSVSGFETLDFEFDGATYTVSGLSASATGKVVGEYASAVTGTPVVTDAAGNDVTYKFDVTTVDGKLTINKRNVTLTSATASKEYDGTPLTDSTVTVTGDGFAEDEGAAYTVTGSQTIAGSSGNKFTYEVNDGTDINNYNITKVEGLLTVTDRNAKYEITVEANSHTDKYDGTAKSVSGFKTLAFTVNGQEYTVSGLEAGATGTNAGTYPAAVTGTPVVTDAAGNDVTNQFIVKTVDGALTINKREVTLTSATDSKEYDGRALTKKEVTVSGDDFVKGEGVTYDVTGTITLVGWVNNVFAYELNDGTLAENYNITVKYGTLTILSRTALYEITVEANSDTVLYDRTEHVVTGFKTLIFEVEGSTYTVSGLTAEGKGTNAGTYSVAVTGNAVVKDAAGNNVTNQFSVSTQPGTLTINKREVVLTSATDSKPYDGTPLYNNNVEVTGDGFATGEGAGYSVTGTQTLVGSSENYFTYTLNEGTNEDNYTITVHYGQLTVTSREAKYEIEVEANSGEFKYDGTEKNVSGFVTTEFTVNGQTYTVSGLTAEAKATDAGTVAVNVVGTPTVKDANGNDVTSEFAVTTKAGYLIITKRVITLTSATAEKEYNGTPLKDATVTVSGDDFAAGEGAAYDVTGSQTLVGSSNNYFTYTLNENTKAENYEITKVEGTLTVKDRSEKYEITVEANSGEFKYDGTEKNVTGLKETVFTVDGQTYTVEGLTAAAAGTDAGTYKAEVTGTAVVKDAADNDVTAQFIVKRIDGTLEITKRVLTLTSATDEKEYDGTPLTNDTVNVTGDGFAENEGAAYNVTGSQTIVGSSSNEFTYTLNENTKADNYTITKIEGQLTVTNREAKYEINVVANSDSFKYDGTEKSVSGLKATEFTVNGQQYTVEGLEASAAGTDAGTYAANVIGTPVVKDAKGNDVTEQFKVTTTPGTLEITKRDVTLTSGSAERQYNGTPLTNDTITVSGDDFAAGEGATYNVTGSQTLVGSSDNTFTYTLNSNTKAENYNITVVEGQLNVTNRNAKYTITVEANSGNDKYDGTEKSVSGFKTLTFTVEGQTYTVSELTAEAKATDAGEYAVNVVGTPVVTDAAGNDVSAQFAVSTVAGKLTIVKREVTLISASDTQQYNGTPLTNDTITVGGDDFAAGEGATYDVTGSQTLVGSSDNTFSYTLNEGTKADNYVITKEEGTLMVIDRDVKYEVTVTANSKQFMYDGTEKSVSGFETLTFVVEGQTYTVEGLKAEAKGTDADTYIAEVTGTAVVKDAENHDVTAQFLVKTVDGTLVINKRAVTLTSGTDSKQYDGTALINDTVTETGDGFVKGEGAVYDVTGSQTLVGSSANTFTYTLKAGTKAGNYDITKVEGQLTVTDRDTKYQIEVVANGGEYKYDGTEKAVSGFKTLNFIVDGQQYSVSGLTASAAGTDAGTYTVNVEGTAVVKDVLGNDVTAQFAVITVPGTLTIEKRTVVMTSAIDSKQYDGKALTNDTVTVTGDGFADGEGAAYRVTGSQTLVGSSDNTFTYTLNSNTKADNYTIETVEGTLTVINREAKYEVTVKANNATEKYDGTEKSVSGFETLTFTVNGEQYTVEGLTAEAKATDAGTYTAAVEGTAVVKDADGNNVTAQFVVKTEDGQLTIEKRNVTLTSATDSKPYDGTPLINHEVTVSGDGFVEGEGAVYDVTGTRTLVGSNANAFTYELKDGTKADNYVITKVEGTLTITNREAKYEITVVANGGIEKYDGTEKTVTGFETLAFTVNGQQYTVSGLSAEGKGTDAGSYDVKVTGTAVVKDAEGNVVTDQFAVKSVQGTLTIQKRNVTLTSATDSKQYDGTPLRNSEVTVTGDGFVEGEGAVYDVTGSQLLVGTSANSFTYTLKDNTKADNYIIETKEGQLSVTSREAKYEITVVANSGTEKYDGTEKTVTGFETLTFVVEGQTYTVEGLTAEAKAIDAGTYAVSVEGTAVVKDVAGNNVTDQFAVTTQAGSLVIEKRNVTLTSASAEKEYNGTPLTNDKVEVSGDGFVTGEGAAYVVTGSQTLVGSSDNTYTYTLNENTKAENYNITKAEGTLTVNARDEKYVITVVANSGSGKYDGTVKMVSGFETLAFTVDGQNYTVEGLTAENSQTNAGTYTVKVEGTAVVRDSNNNDVTSQFTVNTVDGQLTIEKRNVTLTSATASKPYDGTALTNDTVDVSDEGFVSGEGAAYNVTGSQTLVGTSKNTFGYTLNENTLAANYNITTVEGDLTVTDDGKNPVSKDHAEGPFGLGDTITFTITVENIYAETKTITVTEQEGVTLLAKDGVEIKAGKAIIADVAPGAVVTVEATYVVTEADLLAGEFTNTVTAVFSGEDNSYEAEDIVGTDEFDDLNGHLTVTKVTTSTPKNGSTYALGEKITYKITVKNDGNLTITGIEVEDELTKDSWTIDSLVPGESEEFTAEYVVTEADVLAGSVVNVATAKGTSPDPSTPDVPVDPGEKEEPTDPKNGHLTITKDTTSTPENSIAYVLGETIKYEITATNDGNLTVSDITVTDDLTGDTWNIAALAPGESKAFTAEHVVTEADILAGTVENVATAKGTSPDPDTPDVPVEPGKKVDETEDKNGHLIITKETTSTPKNGTAYALDEIITYKITVTNDGNLTITNITVTDEMTGDEWTVASLAPGETKEFDAKYQVLEKDVLATEVVNVATAKGTSPDPEKPDVPVDPGEKEDPVTTPAPSLFVEKTADKKSGNELGDTITYTIKVVNNGNVTVNDIDVEDEMTGMSEAIASLAPGAERTFTTTYKVAEKDILKGEIVNVVTAKGTDPNKNSVNGSDDETVGTAAKNGHLTITKETTSTPENGESYALGETIEYKITVTNDGNLTITDTTVEDELTGDKWLVSSIEPGESREFTAEYVVTEEDILAGSVVNEATAKGTSPDPEKPDVPVVPGEEEDPTEPTNGHLTIEKVTTSTPANGAAYALGETIEYKITVTNDGNLTITDITVEDELTEDSWKLASLAPGESEEFTAKYVVTEKDILAGTVVNDATAKGTSPDPDKPDVPVDPGKEEDKTEDKNGHLTVTKVTTSTPSNAEKYALGEKITYKITATNDGNLTLTDVAVTDELTGDEWNIDTLAPGESKDFTAEYVVTEKDILAGQVVNEATAKGDSPDPEKPDVPVDPGKEEDKTEDKNGHLTITKVTTSSPSNAEKYALGETITYKITATNDGNLTLTDVVVTDELTNDEWKIDALLPGESKEFTAEYTVVEEDIHRGYVVNEATAKGDSPDPEKPDVPVDPGKEEDKVDDPKEELAVKKEITNEGFIEGTTEFSIGDTIYYKITVTNTGNVTLTDIPVEDVTTGKNIVEIKKDGILGTNLFADYTVDGTTAVIKELKPSEEIEIICTYVVVRDDNGSTILNTAIAGKDDTRTEDDVPAKVEQTYDINIKHEFADVQSDTSVKLPEDYSVQNKLPGYNEKFVAGAVKGYAASPAIFDVTIVDRDITITFVYYKDTIGTDPTNPSKPDQIPDYYQITFTFVSEDTAKGTVTDVTREVHNLYEIQLDENGRVVEVDLSQVKPVSPNAKVTVTPTNKYKFTKWTSDNARVQEAIAMAAEAVGDNFNTTEEIREAAFITDTVFTAHFAKKSSGGGGGGGGSTPGGGSTTTIGGPGVPTANLPEVPVLEVQEEEVPLAALPKTGRTNANALVMLLSSVMLAAFAVTGKKKEEEN